MAVGVRPETHLAVEAGLKLGKTGGILVDKGMHTSDPAIWAVGDAVEVRDLVTDAPSLIPLAGPANRQGRIAADTMFGRDSRYEKTQGTAICKVFDMAIGMTGLSEKAARRAGFKCEKVFVHPADHASYYPGATPVSLKLLFDPQNGRVLGAQAVGAHGIDKRIDVLAMAVRSGMTVYDLENVELTYAPPYGSAKDAINYAGFVAANFLRGDVKLTHVDEILNPSENQVVVDVRTPEEVAAGTVPGAWNIPVDSLRQRLDELDKKRQYLVLCRVGLRGYLACRILSQNGYDCKNLTGGYTTYRMVTGFADEIPAKRQNDMRDDPGERDQQNLERTIPEPSTVIEMDACGLQCPGPILKLKEGMDKLKTGQAIKIIATDPSFISDSKAWCNTTGNELIDFSSEDGKYIAIIAKRTGRSIQVSQGDGASRGLTIVVFDNDMDKALAAFIIANGAIAMGYDVTLFFTFWGLNILRRDNAVSVRKTSSNACSA